LFFCFFFEMGFSVQIPNLVRVYASNGAEMQYYSKRF